MYEWVKNITSAVEPIYDSIYGPRYRCSLTLKDGAFLPCAVIQSKQRLVDLAKRRIKAAPDVGSRSEVSLRRAAAVPRTRTA